MKTKHWIHVFAGAMLVAWLSAAPVAAQDCHGHGGGHGHGGKHAWITSELGLSEAQAKQMDAIHEKYKPQIHALKEAENPDREQLHALRDAMHNEVEALLTPEQKAKLEALKAEHHGRAPYSAYRGPGCHGGHGMHEGHPGKGHPGKGHSSEGHTYFEENVLPVMKTQRAKLEAQLRPEDKAEIAALRARLEAVRPERKAVKQEMRSAEGATEGDHAADMAALKSEMEALRAEHRAVMEAALEIGQKYEQELAALHAEIAPQVAQWMADMEKIHAAHAGEGPGKSGKAHGEKFCKMMGSEEHHHKMLAHFILMDPAESKGARRASAALQAKMEVYPNPAGASTTLRYTVAQASKVKIELLSQEGRLVRLVEEREVGEGEQTVLVETGGLSAGTYFVRVTDGSGARVKQFSVVR